MRPITHSLLLAFVLACPPLAAACGSDSKAADAGTHGDGGEEVDGGGGPCGAITCPAGFDCTDGVCQDGVHALVPYDLVALRADPSLDVHVSYAPATGPVEVLPMLGVRLEIPAAVVQWRGVGAYAAELRDDDPWWATEPLALTRSRTAADVLAEGSSASIAAQSYQDMGWGLWQNAISNALPAQQARRQEFVDAGLPILGYLEGTGNLFVFLAAIDDPPQKIAGTDVTRTRYTHWNWGAWGGSLPADLQVIWMGPHTYYNAPAYAEPYTKNHAVYGDAVAPTDPDGTPVSSPPEAAADPRLEGLYRECAAADINGEPGLDLHLQGGRDVTGLPGVVNVGGTDYSILGFARDPACPTWLRFHEITMRYAVDNGTVGCWMDNVSLWDAVGLVPVEHAFGSHANAGFESYVVANAPAGFLDRSGLQQHVGQMNMRCIVKWKARTGFGDDPGSAGLCANPIASTHVGLMDPRWDADLPWGAYLAYTADLHVDYYADLRDIIHALDADFLWGTNDLPNYGSPVAEAIPPSMNMAELSLGPHILTGGTELPPDGTLAPIYDLSGAFDLSQFQQVWLYVDEAGLEDSAELHRALAAEALSYDTFLMPAADDPRAPGTTASAASINAWLMDHAAELEGRTPWSRVGLVYSADSWLRSFRPGGVPTVLIPDGAGTRPTHDFAHLHEFAGWHFALSRTRHQTQPVLAGRLQAGALDVFDVVVLPDLEVLPTALRDDVLEPWVRAGGTLVVAGRTGRYRGRTEMFEPWTANAAPSGAVTLTGIADLDQVAATTEVALGAGRVFVIPGAPGADAWLGRGFAEIYAVIAQLEAEGALLSAIATPPEDANVLVRLHVDEPRGRLFIDLVNRNWSQGSDALVPASAQELTVALPEWLRGQALTVRTAASRGSATMTAQQNAVEVVVGAFEDVVTVVVESQVPGGRNATRDGDMRW